MILVIAALLTVGVVVFTLLVRAEDLPEPVVPSAVRYLEEKKARICEALRDLEFEYSVGKLSKEDCEKMELSLKKDLNRVTAEIESVVEATPVPPASARVCPECGAGFDRAMKFCGECGKPMRGEPG